MCILAEYSRLSNARVIDRFYIHFNVLASIVRASCKTRCGLMFESFINSTITSLKCCFRLLLNHLMLICMQVQRVAFSPLPNPHAKLKLRCFVWQQTYHVKCKPCF